MQPPPLIYSLIIWRALSTILVCCTSSAFRKCLSHDGGLTYGPHGSTLSLVVNHSRCAIWLVEEYIHMMFYAELPVVWFVHFPEVVRNAQLTGVPYKASRRFLCAIELLSSCPVFALDRAMTTFWLMHGKRTLESLLYLLVKKGIFALLI